MYGDEVVQAPNMMAAQFRVAEVLKEIWLKSGKSDRICQPSLCCSIQRCTSGSVNRSVVSLDAAQMRSAA